MNINQQQIPNQSPFATMAQMEMSHQQLQPQQPPQQLPQQTPQQPGMMLTDEIIFSHQFSMMPPPQGRSVSAPDHLMSWATTPAPSPHQFVVPQSSMPQAQTPRNRSFSFDDDDDDDGIDTSNMTQEEKNDIKLRRKLKKMNREKAKRAKLNDQFDQLCRMLSMSRSTRVEKLAVLTETIRTVCELQAENNGLRMQSQRFKQELERRRTGKSTSVPPITMPSSKPAEITPPGAMDESIPRQTPEEMLQRPGVMVQAGFGSMSEPPKPKKKSTKTKVPVRMKSEFDKHVKTEFKQEFKGELPTAPLMFQQNPNSDLDFAFGRDDEAGSFWAANANPHGVDSQVLTSEPMKGGLLQGFPKLPPMQLPQMPLLGGFGMEMEAADDSVDMFFNSS